MKKIYRALIFLATITVMQSCNNTEPLPPPVEDNPCGGALQWYRILDMDATLIVAKVENGFRIFQFEDLSEPSDICSEEEATAKYTVDLKQAGSSSDISFAARAYWIKVDDTEPIDFDHTSDFYYKEMKLGLKEAFPNMPGYAGLQIHVKFPTKGSLEADKAYLKDNISYMRIDVDYKEYKEE